MIIVRLIGGLGNQMFQYAFGKALALKYNTILKFDTLSLLDRSNTLYTHRDYELDVFDIEKNVASSLHINKFKNSTSVIAKILTNLSPKLSYKTINEEGFVFDSNDLKEKTNLYLNGYWQSEKYFIEYEAQIRKSFFFKKEASLDNKQILKQIKETASVSVHFRRGDYVSLESAKEVHGVCSFDYYYRAIEMIASKEKNPFFYIFSDEPEWVKENFKLNFPSLIIAHNSGKKSYEDLRLMSACKHNIIANSSFSWWGAWLNENNKKIVIAPRLWFLNRTVNTEDLIPVKWIRI